MRAALTSVAKREYKSSGASAAIGGFAFYFKSCLAGFSGRELGVRGLYVAAKLIHPSFQYVRLHNVRCGIARRLGDVYPSRLAGNG